MIIILIGYILCITNKPESIWLSVGASIIAAGITGLVVFVYMLLAQTAKESLDIIYRFGIVNAYEGRSVMIKSEYDNRLNYMHERIDIMGFGLKALREDYLDQFSQWKQRVKIRILLIDPCFPSDEHCYANQRDYEERDTHGTIKQQVQQFIQDTKEIRGIQIGHTFEIRLYRCLPAVNIFRIDDELFWGPYLIKQPSRNSPTFLVRRGGLLFDRLVDHFEHIWNDDNLSRPIPNNW
jgi:hypothetical protein